MEDAPSNAPSNPVSAAASRNRFMTSSPLPAVRANRPPRTAFWPAHRILVWQARYHILLLLEKVMKPALIALLGLLAASSSAAQARNPPADPAKPAVCSVSGL